MKPFQHLTIKPTASLRTALAQMDKVGYKLLMIAEDGETLLGLVTIGDVQRAIIANVSLDEKVKIFSDKKLIVASHSDPLNQIKSQMLSLRLVYMPVLDEDGKICNVIFWEDIIAEGEKGAQQKKLNLPVVIMAGGFGSRLKPLTNVLPKPLLPFGETTILENIISRFLCFGCSVFHVSVNYKAPMIENYFADIEGKDYEVDFFTEPQPLGTAGSLNILKNKITTPFFVSNCDILVDEDYSAIYDYHKSIGNELTLVASMKHVYIPYGTVESGEDGKLLSLKEKPQLDFLVNSGMYILEPHLLNEIPENTFFHITDLIEKINSRGGRVGVFPITEKSWVDIGEWHLYSKILIP